MSNLRHLVARKVRNPEVTVRPPGNRLVPEREVDFETNWHYQETRAGRIPIFPEKLCAVIKGWALK